MEITEKIKLYDSILNDIRRDLSKIPNDPATIYITIIEHLANIPYFHWTGLYLYNKVRRELYLGTFSGKNSKQSLIKLGDGACGSAVAYRIYKIVDDVTKYDNSITSSPDTRSEIAIVLEDRKEIIGILDIESNEIGAFDINDRKYLQEIAETAIQKMISI
ncbi:MAG: GAF domain-containing protein [Candidatus Hodarchaeales archaeon]|jgi:GAF domain-containing protein